MLIIRVGIEEAKVKPVIVPQVPCTTGFIALGVGSQGKYSTRLYLVLYLPLDPPLVQ